MTPSMAIEVNRAVAVAMASGAQAGLQMLLCLESLTDGYYPYHAALSDLLRRMNQHEPASDAHERALALCGNNAERTYLQRRLEEMLNFVG
jgi:RNA polymerase sigma-70 factor (ECF subfamily)